MDRPLPVSSILLSLALGLLPCPARAGPPAGSSSPVLGPGLILERARLARVPRSAAPIPLLTTWDGPGRGPEDAVCVGRVCALQVAPAGLDALLSRPGLETLDLPRRLAPRLDQAGPLLGLPAARATYGLTGRGVLIGVIDTGLDFTHPDFVDPEGRTRVAWLLDQGLPPAGLHPELEALGGGAVFSSAELQAVLDGQGGPAAQAGLDPFGHGTHVAGVAASNDRVYTGVAPEADLVIVKADGPGLRGFEEDQVLRALAFVAEAARREACPLSLNLSFGTQLGAHDGSDPIELALTELARARDPSTAVAVAAGNEGQADIHARCPVEGRLRLGLRVAQAEPPSPVRPARVVVEAWHEAPLSALVESPAGERTQAIGAEGQSLDEWTTHGRIQLATASGPRPENGLWHTRLVLSGEAGRMLAQGDWWLELQGQSARLDAWVGETDLAGSPGPRFVTCADPDEQVGPPATAEDVVAVGAFHARRAWTDAEGQPHEAGGPVGRLAAFSTRGPTRDGRPKPELVAPGVLVASSLSQDSDPRSLDSLFYAGGSLRQVTQDGRHALATGTSMAAPFAAGLAALVLEQAPGLRGAEVAGLLRAAGQADLDSGFALFEPGWGFGKASALLALGLGAGERGAPVAAAASLCGVAKSWLPDDPHARLWALAAPRDEAGLACGPGLPVSLEAEGAVFAGPVEDLGDGLYRRALSGQGRLGEELRLRCAAGGVDFAAEPRVRFARSWQEASDPGFGRGDGCATAGFGPLAGWLALALVGLSARSWSRRTRSSPSRRTCPRRG
jgi:subtilisin family serine protease